VRFVVSAGGARTPAVAFGCDGRLPVADEQPADATFRLERNAWNGTVEPRLVLREAWSCAPEQIVVLDERDHYLDGVIEELDRELGEPPAARSDHAQRTVIDRRGESPLAVLADALASGSEVLAVCADVDRRLDGLGARIGGFALISHHALERAPKTAERFQHVVALDPPAGEGQAAAMRAGSGFTHMGWGDAELRFAEQMHELEYGLRVFGLRSWPYTGT
jgi:hypothetical protein